MRAIAFYLPQFHPTPDNDEFWGPGFTEWTNVRKARRLFPGHEQPRRPSELGYYDLRDPAVRVQQADLARTHGVSAFCYWHYWFGGGRRTLERPFAEVLESGQPDFPFCLGWANETWSGVWHGNPGRVLIEQTYPGIDDERAHFEVVLPAFHDARYVCVDGRPLFLVYHPHLLPDARELAAGWQRWSSKAGLPGLFLVGMSRPGWLPSANGFDAVVMGQTIPPSEERARHERHSLDRTFSGVTNRTSLVPAIYSYRRWSPFMPHVHPDPEQVSFPTVVPGWDNTPRSGRRGKVFVGATPQQFQIQVERARQLLDGRPDELQILFVKSWNEWAEGNYLEPDERHGRAFLEAFRDAMAGGGAEDASR